MVQEQDVMVENTWYRVVISDEAETLLAAKAAGRVIVACLRKDGTEDLSIARYGVEDVELADKRYLERVIRREKNLPWIIWETKELLLREFTKEDSIYVLPEPEDKGPDQIFYDSEKLSAYIRSQYGFFEYGLWAVVRKEDGRLLGKAGLTDCSQEGHMELAYHIFAPYRRRGYGEKACRMVLSYVKQEYDCPLYALIEAGNKISAGLLRKLGFHFMGQECNGSRHRYCLFAPY
ncbi:MAG: GNAT family N-acetyltransferase [Lachnospiraceae bacterium]|jgi:RimJ/RimL family protein N-acetyltransferase|nr:GNAT family N-acetyltransferase [Lachnospiraceae bacterium]